MKTLAEAVKEAGEFIAAVEQSGDDRDAIDVQMLSPWSYPVLTLGTVRALYALGADIARYAGLFTPEDLARAISGEPR